MKRLWGEKISNAIQVIIFFSGILIFIWFLKKEFPWHYFSISGIIISTAVLMRDVRSTVDMILAFDLRKLKEKSIYLLVIALLAGILLAMVFRDYLSIRLLPRKLVFFTMTAVLIGSAEEIIFRGYIQRKLRKISIILAVTSSSFLHTCYKCAIFLFLPPFHEINYLLLFFWTMVIGSLLGILKELSGSTFVPIAAHGSFDLVAYGDGMIHAWWVWM